MKIITLVKFSIFLIVTAFLTSCARNNSLTSVATEILPEPQNIELKKGVSFNPQKIKNIYLYSKADENAHFTGNMLQDEINKLFGYLPELQVLTSYNEIVNPAIILGIASEDTDFAEFSSNLPAPEKENEESYVIDINKKFVTISGGGKAGLFYGVQTIIQLLEESKWADHALPGMLIRDWPEMEHRLVHYNYFFHLDRFEYIKESIVKLARYKINGIVFEFEDRFKYQSHPFIPAPTSLTSDQVKELTIFARKYHINIIPLVQGFGHAAYLLKHEELKHLREDPDIFQSFCPLREGTYDLIFDLFREVIEATPGVKYFHVGADEVRVMGQCPLCKKKKEEIGDLGLYLTWLNRVHDFMKEHGRTIIFWDDMPLKQAGIYRFTHSKADETFDSIWPDGITKLENIINKFPKDAIFMRWNYELGREKGNINILDWYNKNDFNTMIATAVIGNYPLIPDYNSTLTNIQSYITLGAEKEVMGTLCTAWGDDAGNHFEIYWPGFLATAEFTWNSKAPATIDRYWEKYIRRFFGPNTIGLIQAFNNLSERVSFWNSALMRKGFKHRRAYQLLALPEVNIKPSEGSWKKQFQSIVERAEYEKNRCIGALDTLNMNIDLVNSNVYNLEVFSSMGQLMKSHCDLVLALGEIAEACDNAVDSHSKGRKEDVIANLNKMSALAESAWNDYYSTYENLKYIWEIARYPKGEEGYMMDTQTNYLAGWTADLSYLILAEKQLDFAGYAKKLRELSDKYEKTAFWPN